MKKLNQLLLIVLLSTQQKINTSTSIPIASIHPIPSTIKIESLTHSYESSLFSKLFSSVPKRKLAIDDINLNIQPFSREDDNGDSSNSEKVLVGGITLLVGASACGKSTLLWFLTGDEKPNYGNIFINNEYVHNSSIQPIILERKPDYNDSHTVIEWMVNIGLNSNPQNNDDNSIFQTLANDFCNVLEIDKNMKQCVPSLLSPSQQYLFGIACSCMKSVASSVATEKYEKDNIHYPILLFDELFDKEHSNIVTKLKQSILNLTFAGGIVIVATHKPYQLEDIARRKITLSGGRILNDVSL